MAFAFLGLGAMSRHDGGNPQIPLREDLGRREVSHALSAMSGGANLHMITSGACRTSTCSTALFLSIQVTVVASLRHHVSANARGKSGTDNKRVVWCSPLGFED